MHSPALRLFGLRECLIDASDVACLGAPPRFEYTSSRNAFMNSLAGRGSELKGIVQALREGTEGWYEVLAVV